jgi:hypothetical protein
MRARQCRHHAPDHVHHTQLGLAGTEPLAPAGARHAGMHRSPGAKDHPTSAAVLVAGDSREGGVRAVGGEAGEGAAAGTEVAGGGGAAAAGPCAAVAGRAHGLTWYLDRETQEPGPRQQQQQQQQQQAAGAAAAPWDQGGWAGQAGRSAPSRPPINQPSRPMRRTFASRHLQAPCLFWCMTRPLNGAWPRWRACAEGRHLEKRGLRPVLSWPIAQLQLAAGQARGPALPPWVPPPPPPLQQVAVAGSASEGFHHSVHLWAGRRCRTLLPCTG